MKLISLYHDSASFHFFNNVDGLSLVYYHGVIEKRISRLIPMHGKICGSSTDLNNLRKIVKFLVDSNYIF